MHDDAIVLQGICKRYPAFELDHVTLRVPRGTIMGLIGENGAGKTTTLKALLGIIRPDEGKISILGQTGTAGIQAAKERVGVVLDEGFFPDTFTAKEMNTVCKRIYNTWQPDAFVGWLHRLGLPDNKKYKELSKGMRTKLAISVALSHQAELLILDEATGGLDPVVRAEMLDVFLDFMQDERHAILFSTHITTDLERIADEITFLHGGRVVLQQEKDSILTAYGILKCGQMEYDALDRQVDAVGSRKGAFGYEVLLRDRHAYLRAHPDAIIDPATLDDMMLYTIRGFAK